MKGRLTVTQALALIAAVVLAATCVLGAPAPLARRDRDKTVFRGAGDYDLYYNGTRWDMSLDDDNNYTATSSGSGERWVGKWYPHPESDLIMIQERPANSDAQYAVFPFRRDGRLMVVPETDEQGYYWSYAGSKVRIERK